MSFAPLLATTNAPRMAKCSTHITATGASDWSQHFISAYAAMHPREDFAETWASYLDMVSTLDTAQHIGMGGETDPIHADIGRMLARYQDLGVAFNEINRNMGLLDVVPEVFVVPVIAKLGFIHQLVRLARSEFTSARDGALRVDLSRS